MGKTTTKQARPPVKASPPASAVTDHSRPASKRVELATTAAWEIWTLCDEILKHTAKIDGSKEPHHSKCIIKVLVSRAHELAEVAALCLQEDEANQPFADLESRVSQ